MLRHFSCLSTPKSSPLKVTLSSSICCFQYHLRKQHLAILSSPSRAESLKHPRLHQHREGHPLPFPAPALSQRTISDLKKHGLFNLGVFPWLLMWQVPSSPSVFSVQTNPTQASLVNLTKAPAPQAHHTPRCLCFIFSLICTTVQTDPVDLFTY